MDSNRTQPESLDRDRSAAEPDQAEQSSRRESIVRVAKYSAPLIAALIPDKARAFSF